MPIVQPVPAPDNPWDLIPLEEQFRNHDEYRPPAIDTLAGRTLQLHFVAGPVIAVEFHSPSSLAWSTEADIPGLQRSGVAEYEAFEIRDQIHGVVVADLPQRASALVIVDQLHERALINLTQIVCEGSDVREETRYWQAGIGGSLSGPFRRTTELVGKRVHQRYSSTHAFEHIYLNPNTYAFQCLEGPEAGVADVDLCDYYKLDKELYLFSWHERLQPFNGAVIVDLREQRARGRLFGWDEQLGEALQVRTGTTATLLNETNYEGR
jgi:hypothetical protein